MEVLNWAKFPQAVNEVLCLLNVQTHQMHARKDIRRS